MVVRFQLNCARILVLSTLLQSFVSHCHPEFIKDISNAEDSGYAIEEQRNNLDPSIEKIFRGSSERRDEAADSKRNIAESKTAIQSEEVNKHVRVKRDGAIKTSNSKSLNEATRNDAKRSTSDKNSGASSRIGRSSRDLPKLQDKDYEVPLDQGKSEYADEAEDESPVGSINKESKYKAGEFRVGEDSERFIDQEERSSLYDDFETKDVVKRGISGAEDYEEVDEDVGAGEDTALEDGSVDEEMDKRKVRGDVRVKREHESAKEAENVDASEKTGNPDASSGLSNDRKTAEVSVKQDVASDKDGKVAESLRNIAEKDSNDQLDQSKRNAPEKNENDASKVNSERDTDASKQSLITNDQTEIESGENAKLQTQESQEATGDRKTQEVGLSSSNNAANDLASDPSSLTGASKTDDTKIVEAPGLETAKVDSPVAGDGSKSSNSRNEAAAGEQLDANYEKRVEEQIQRKIDSIKEEIKREIAENERVKEIEENNAKFDELREQEDDEDDGEGQALENEPSEKRDGPSKRSARNSGKSLTRESGEKRSVKRKKRQGDTDLKRVQGAGESSSSKKARQAKKRSVTIKSGTPKKREYPRQVFLVRNDRKKKRKRRSKNPASISEQRSTKLEDSLRGDLDGKSSASRMTEDEKAMVGQDSFSGKKSGSVASLTGSNEELGPLATEYGEAFGGLNGEPGVALARFKRIKRVLRPSASKT